MSTPNPATTEWVPLWDTKGGATGGGPHHATHEVGGSDALVNAAWTNQPNVFTDAQKIERVNGSILTFSDTSNGADLKKFRLLNFAQLFRLQTVNDAESAVLKTPLTCDRNGNVTIGAVGAGGSVAGTNGNIAAKDQSNIFTAQQYLRYATPRIQWDDTSQPVDGRKYELLAVTGELWIQVINDAENIQQSLPLRVIRNGDIVVGRDVAVSRDLYEKGRTVPLGHWTSFTPSFSASAGTVNLNAAYGVRYSLVGKQMSLSVLAAVQLTADAVWVRLALPGGLVCAAAQASAMPFWGTSVEGLGTGVVETQAGTTYISLQRDLASAQVFRADGYQLAFNVVIAVQ